MEPGRRAENNRREERQRLSWVCFVELKSKPKRKPIYVRFVGGVPYSPFQHDPLCTMGDEATGQKTTRGVEAFVFSFRYRRYLAVGATPHCIESVTCRVQHTFCFTSVACFTSPSPSCHHRSLGRTVMQNCTSENLESQV